MARRKSVPAAGDGVVAATDCRVVLPADLGFAAARDLHESLLPLVDAEKVLFDAAAVERVSTAAILVIASFLAAREALTPPAAVEGAGGAFVDAFSELGLFATLMRMEFRP